MIGCFIALSRRFLVKDDIVIAMVKVQEEKKVNVSDASITSHVT